ncbi:DUF4247 domain-containing protein [Streptomyces hainanensis]|uniref:DUF4247 domain-containing protein n=1 Tax=Streptomyces hainanensis TaxID=402648 RepID=A0A4R4TDP2_9ACTN|nr:DUF4247 domain-containing protein [Streptomyces hainanensis]TDC74286.1 DUF4247 domain-containing protein [Streptomyces hainanensis]
MRRSAISAAALLALLPLTGCGSDDDPDVPRRWIESTYERTGGERAGLFLDRDTRPARVADAIEGETGAIDRIEDDGSVFLRYDDDIVAITPYGAALDGSRIDIDDYETGRSRYSSHVSHRWPAAQRDSGGDFRGGGPGSGK